MSGFLCSNDNLCYDNVVGGTREKVGVGWRGVGGKSQIPKKVGGTSKIKDKNTSKYLYYFVGIKGIY